MSTLYGDPGAILKHHRTIETALAAGVDVMIRGTFAVYNRETWEAFKASELDRRINEKAIRLGHAPIRDWRKLDGAWQTSAARDCRRLREHREQRIRLPRRFETPEIQRRFGHLCPDPREE